MYSTSAHAGTVSRSPWWPPRLSVRASLYAVHGAVAAASALFAFRPIVVGGLTYAHPLGGDDRSWLLLLVWFVFPVACGTAAAIHTAWLIKLWRSRKAVLPLEADGTGHGLRLFFSGRLRGPGGYRIEDTTLVLFGRLLPSPSCITIAWCIGLVFTLGVSSSGNVAAFEWVVMYLFALFLFGQGTFQPVVEIRLQRANVDRCEVDRSRLTLWVRGLFEREASSIAIYASPSEYPRFFSRFHDVFPDLLPAACAEAARRVELFRTLTAGK